MRGKWNASFIFLAFLRVAHLVFFRPPSLAALDVGREVDLVGQFADVHLEPVLHLVERLGVGLVRHEGDGEALGAEAARSRDSVSRMMGVITCPNFSQTRNVWLILSVLVIHSYQLTFKTVFWFIIF